MMPNESAYELLVNGRQLLKEKRYLQAIEALERACEIEPAKGSIREALARALYNNGEVRKASEQFRKALEISPADDYAHFGLALCCAKLGDKVTAIGHLRIALAMKPDSEDYLTALDRLAG